MLELGAYGGRYVPETLVPALDELEAGWRTAQADPGFAAELHALLTSYVPCHLSEDGQIGAFSKLAP